MDLVRLFFSPTAEDNRGDILFHLGYNGTEYSKPINAANPEALVTEPIRQFMTYGATNEKTVSKQFIKFLLDTGLHHATLDDGKAIGGDDKKEAFFNSIYKNTNVPSDVRKFYMTFLHVVDMNTNQPVTNFANVNLSSVRFNLAKVSTGVEDKANILFAASLPLLCTCMSDLELPLIDTTTLSDTIKKKLQNSLQKVLSTVSEHKGKLLLAGLVAIPVLGGLSGFSAWATASAASSAIMNSGIAESIVSGIVTLKNATLAGNVVKQVITTAVGFPMTTALALTGGANDSEKVITLTDIYNYGYAGLDGTPIDSKFLEVKKSDKTKFELDIKDIIKRCIIARDKPVPAAAVSSQPLEDLYESVVTGVRYVRDSDGKLRVMGKDGKIDTSKDFEEAELGTALNMAAPNCASTGINLSDCTVVYQCLLSGKPETLAECLDKLKNADMFAQARKEVASMNPKVAVQLLRTFGFKPRKEAGSNVVLPPTFDEWSGKLSRTVDAGTAEAIRGNKKLMEYLRAVVDIVRSNPAIINKDLKNGVSSAFAKKYGLDVFRNPFPAKAEAPSVVDGVLFTPLAQSMQLPLALRIANISGRVPMPYMSGGGQAECVTSGNLKVAFNKIYAEMEKNGKVLVDSDKSRINATIEKLGKLETQLIRLMDDAKLFSKLNAALNPAEPVVTENVTLNDIVNVRSDSITGSTLNNLNDCISKNVRDQSQLSADLVNKVQMPLLQLLMRGGSDALSQVN